MLFHSQRFRHLLHVAVKASGEPLDTQTCRVILALWRSYFHEGEMPWGEARIHVWNAVLYR